jgi:hypothetical protein
MAGIAAPAVTTPNVSSAASNTPPVNVFEPRLPVLATVVMSLRTVWALLYVDLVRYARIGSVSRLMVPSRSAWRPEG